MYMEGSLHLLFMMAVAERRAVGARRCFARESGTVVGLRTMTMKGLFGRASTMPEDIVHALVLSHSSSGPICAS